MRTIKLTIEFDGTAYVGWQRQANGMSVQQVVEEALQRVVGDEVCLLSSGRTDAGVHARGMVAHFRTERQLPLCAFAGGVNRLLPPDIAIKQAEEAPPDFHARHNARGKWYRYTIQNGPLRAPLVARFAWNVRRPLDRAAMAAAARHLIGYHDFAAFRTTGCDARTTERTIFRINLSEEGPELIHIDVVGDGFMRHMVRILVGTLVEIGLGKRPVDDTARLLSPERGSLPSGATAPAQGLTLMEVYYTDDFKYSG